MSVEAAKALEQEALLLALGHLVPVPTAETGKAATRALYGYQIQQGRILTYDDVLDQDIPLVNIRLRAQLGTSISYTITNSEGKFKFPNQLSSGPSYYLSLIYHDPTGKWKIATANNTTEPYEISIGLQAMIPDYAWTPDYFVLPENQYRVNEIHRAVNYFYNVQNVFPKYYPPTGLRIIARSDSGGSVTGWLNLAIYRDKYGSILMDETLSALWIGIYNNGNSDNNVVQTILHEIGHAIHVQNDLNIWSNISSFLRESFASYVGWYLGQEYYKSLGWVHPGGNPSVVSNNARQSWTKTTNSTFGGGLLSGNLGWYSPLFVDLTDDFNQKQTPSHMHPNDEIEGVPASAVWDIISTNSDYWSGVRPAVEELVGSSPNFDEWIENFDESPVNN